MQEQEMSSCLQSETGPHKIKMTVQQLKDAVTSKGFKVTGVAKIKKGLLIKVLQWCENEYQSIYIIKYIGCPKNVYHFDFHFMRHLFITMNLNIFQSRLSC